MSSVTIAQNALWCASTIAAEIASDRRKTPAENTRRHAHASALAAVQDVY
jgi:hypothetical protein